MCAYMGHSVGKMKIKTAAQKCLHCIAMLATLGIPRGEERWPGVVALKEHNKLSMLFATKSDNPMSSRNICTIF